MYRGVPVFFILFAGAAAQQNNFVPQSAATRGASPGETPALNMRDAKINTTCRAYDGNECGCASEDNCVIHPAAGNKCIGAKSECQFNPLWPTECKRGYSFYSIGGSVCHNNWETGECQRDLDSKSNYAINFNGVAYTDANGIDYKDHNTTIQSNNRVKFWNASDYGTSVCKKRGRGNEVDIQNYRKDLRDADLENLLWTYVEGTNDFQNAPSCLVIPIPIKQDGAYELDLKVVEMDHAKSRKRYFDIKVNQKIIFSNIDLYRLIGRECIGIDLMLNFFVAGDQKYVVLSGYEPMPIEDGHLKIELCTSNCNGESISIQNTKYIASSLSVTRLLGKGPFCG